MLKIILIILLAEVWGTSGQILFKKSVNSLETPHLKNPRSYLNFIKGVLRIPAIWMGLGCVFIGTTVWFVALAQTSLSIAFPIDSMQYIVVLIFARIFLGEKVDFHKLIGTLLIVGGVVLVALH